MSEPDKAAECRERISALADGQLRGEEFARALEAAVHETDARAAWHVYHVIGDALRSGATAACCSADTGFALRFAARLAREVPPERPAVPEVAIEKIAENNDRISPRVEKSTQNSSTHAANSPVFRWKMAAGFASVVALGAVGWNLLGSASAPLALPQLALTSESAPAGERADRVFASAGVAVPFAPAAHNSGPSQMMRDSRLDELLAAHEQSGGVSALQMPAGFLRNATFEGRSR